MKFSKDFFAKNLKNWRGSKRFSQTIFSDQFKSLGESQAKRAIISSYENGTSIPKLEFIFEVISLSGATMDDWFSKVIDWKAEKTDTDIVNEPPSLAKYNRASNFESMEEVMAVLQDMSKAVAIIPQLYARVEELERQRDAKKDT